MDQLKKWFEEAEKHTKVFRDKTSLFIIYKGFKITKSIDKYFIQDVRFRDVYSEVSPKDNKILQEFGFIKGVDLITFNRDLARARIYTIRTEKFYKVRDSLQKSDPKFSSKMSNCIDNINKSLDLMFYYQTRVNQFKIKYNGKNKKVEDQARAIESFQKSKQRA